MPVRFINPSKLKEMIRSKRGLVLILSHVGSWQVALSALGFLNKPVNLLLHQEQGDIDRHYFEHAGMAFPYHIIDPNGYLGGVLEMLEVLKQGQVLCVMGDRILGNLDNALSIPFLGENALFPFSAFKLASVAQAPVAVLYTYKTGPSDYALQLAKLIQVPENLGRQKERFQPYVAQYVETLEAFAEAHPYQFFNFYDMWAQD